MTSLTGATTVDVPRGLVWSIGELMRPTSARCIWCALSVDFSTCRNLSPCFSCRSLAKCQWISTLLAWGLELPIFQPLVWRLSDTSWGLVEIDAGRVSVYSSFGWSIWKHEALVMGMFSLREREWGLWSRGGGPLRTRESKPSGVTFWTGLLFRAVTSGLSWTLASGWDGCWPSVAKHLLWEKHLSHHVLIISVFYFNKGWRTLPTTPQRRGRSCDRFWTLQSCGDGCCPSVDTFLERNIRWLSWS